MIDDLIDICDDGDIERSKFDEFFEHRQCCNQYFDCNIGDAGFTLQTRIQIYWAS